MDALERLKGQVDRLEAAAIYGLPRNEYGLSETDRIVGWRWMRVALGEDAKVMANKFPVEALEAAPPPPTQASVIDE